MSGLADKASGKAKQVVGKMTDNKKLELEGEAEELRGKAKDTMSDLKNRVSDKVAEHKHKAA